MTNLFLTIILIVILFLIFRYFQKYKIYTFYAVVVNYYVCVVTGCIFLNKFPDQSQLPHASEWVQFGILTGSLFVPCFYLMGLTVEKVSVSVATVANKMSLVIPVIFSVLFLQKGPDDFSWLNILGVVLSLASIVLTSIKTDKNKEEKKISTFSSFMLPFAIFILGGTIDTLVNYANHTYLKGEAQAIFPLVMFSTAAIIGTAGVIVTILITKRYPRPKDLAAGIILGVPNFFSLYFMLKTLSDFNNDGAVVYPVINIGVIMTGSLMALILFKEKLSPLNLTGICFSAISLILVFL